MGETREDERAGISVFRLFRVLRIPFLSDLGCRIFLAFLPLIFFWRETLGWLTLGDKDAVFWFFPAYKFFAEQILSGNPPLWTPYLYGGTPLFAQWQAGMLDPINWIYLISASSRAMTLSLEISFAVSLLSTFSYTRILGFDRRASVVSAIIYSLGGFAVGRTLYPGFLHIVALMPLVLYFVERLRREGKWRDTVLGGLVVAWQVFAAHPQPLIYSSLLICVYAIFLLRKNDDAQLNDAGKAQSPMRFLLRFSLMFVAGIGLSAVQLLPAWEIAKESIRRDWPYELFTLHSLHPVSLLTTLIPFLHGEGRSIFRMPYWGEYWHHNEAQIYLGVTAISLAFGGAVYAWRTRYRIGVFWSAVALVGIVLSLGKYSGPVARLLYHIPVIGNFRSPNRHWMEVSMAVAVLAGYAVDRLLRETAEEKSSGTFNHGEHGEDQHNHHPRGLMTRPDLASIVRAASCFLLILCCVVCGFVLARKDQSEALLRSIFDLKFFPQGFMRSAGIEFFLPVIIALCATAILFVFTRPGRRNRFYLLLLGVLIVDYNLYAAFAPINTDEKLDELVGRAVPAALTGNENNLDPYRYHLMQIPATGEFNPFWFYGREMASGYDPLMNERYKTFSGIDEAGRSYLKSMLETQDRTLDLLNVRYVFIPPAFFDPALARWGLSAELTSAADLGQGGRIIYPGDGASGDTLAIVSSLANASGVTDGTEVAEVAIICGSGSRWTAALRAGKDTSEWAYERADVSPVIKHSLAPIAESWDGDATGFKAHSYLARIKLPADLIKCNSSRSVQISSKMSGNVVLSLKKIMFEDSTTGKSAELVRTYGAALGDTTRWRELEVKSEAKPYRKFRVYENLRMMPRAWVVNHAASAFEGDQLKLIRGETASDGRRDFDPAVAALVDPETAKKIDPSLFQLGEAKRRDSAAKITARSVTQMTVETESAHPSILVLSEIDLPGWIGFVDGVEVETIRVDYDLRGVELKAGKHRIEFYYRPRSLKVGAAISILTGLFLLAMVLVEKRRKR